MYPPYTNHSILHHVYFVWPALSQPYSQSLTLMHVSMQGQSTFYCTCVTCIRDCNSACLNTVSLIQCFPDFEICFDMDTPRVNGGELFLSFFSSVPVDLAECTVTPSRGVLPSGVQDCKLYSACLSEFVRMSIYCVITHSNSWVNTWFDLALSSYAASSCHAYWHYHNAMEWLVVAYMCSYLTIYQP